MPAEDGETYYNTSGLPAAQYPLSLKDGTYFSEVCNADFEDTGPYRSLVEACLSVLGKRLSRGRLGYEHLHECGLAIQELDFEFAKSRMSGDLDVPHKLVGRDASHPYAKTALCRTAIPVRVGEQDIDLYFEKFLVCYSHLDERGNRKSTVTPIHSHPLNYETVYFTSYGALSRAVEQEFVVVDPAGAPLVNSDASVNVAALRDIGGITEFKVVPGPSSEIVPSRTPIALAAFERDNALAQREDLLMLTDGLFRPHQVSVFDDPSVPTRYFALDNYFGATGRVIIYDPDGRVRLWNRAEWQGS
jgi:hypothetical protein